MFVKLSLTVKAINIDVNMVFILCNYVNFVKVVSLQQQILYLMINHIIYDSFMNYYFLNHSVLI